METENNILYADFEIDGGKNPDMFTVTPEGNYFNFPAKEYDEKHNNIQIVDPKSHKIYTVVFSI